MPGLDFGEYAVTGRLGRIQPYWKARREYFLSLPEVNQKIAVWVGRPTMIGKLGIAADRQGNSEPRWPAGIAVIAIAGLYAALPTSIVLPGPRWSILVIVLLLMVPTIISHRSGHHFLNQGLGYVLNG